MSLITIDEKIRRFSEESPNKVAIEYGDENVTYIQLENKSDLIANFLIDKYEEDKNVFVMMERNPRLVEAFMGVIKSNGIFIPIDCNVSDNRIITMIEEVHLSWIITTDDLLDRVNNISDTLGIKMNVLLMESRKDIECCEFSNLNISVLVDYSNEFNKKYEYCQNKHCYIYFTSGSTGKPKAVLGRQRSLMQFIEWEIKEFGVNSEFKVSQLINPGFDAFLRDVLVPLCAGGTLCIPDNQDIIINPIKLINWIEKEEITLIHTVPSLFKMISSELSDKMKFSSVRYILMSGEQLRGNDIKKFLDMFSKKIGLVNLYGTTETTLIKLFHRINKDDVNKSIVPVGKPIDFAEVLILNEDLQRCAKGIVGYIYIRTPFITSGYCNDKELTRKVFIKNPFSDNHNDIIYKTGDLGRRLDDDNIEVLGRVDNQVKIRGIRIELSEIENMLIQHKLVKESVVADREDKQGNKYLCAYIVSDEEMTVPELRGYLSKDLPDYMIPSYFMQIAKIPLTPNGKIDRKALPEPDGDINTGVEYVAVRNEIEEKIVKVWNEILGVKKIGIDDDFFTLGGHSLKAIQVISMIHKEFNVEVPVSEVFSNPTIRQLGEYIGKCKKSIYSSIKVVEERETYKVSSAQKRLFALNQFAKGEVNYNIPAVMIVEGKLEKSKVEETFRKLVKRHEAFRTSFEVVSEEIMQRIHKEVELSVEHEKIIETKEEVINRMVDKFIRPFDLSKAPLLRVKLVGISEEKHILMVDMHHIVSDGTTIGILIEEFAKIYKGEELEPLRIQYKDYAAWENELLESEGMKAQEEYWMKVFSDEIPVLNMPTDYTRPTVQSFEGDRIIFKIDKELTEKIRKIGDDNGATLYMTLLSAYNILLSKYSGQGDIIVGSPIAGRNHAELEVIVGMFVNTLAMRNYPKGEKTFKEFLQSAKENALKAYENQEYQFDKLVEKVQVRRDLSRNTLFDTMFLLQNTDCEEIEIDDLKFEAYDFKNKISKFDLTLTAAEINEEIGFTLEYCTKLFKKETVERIGEHFLNILREIAEDEDIRISEIEMLTEEEKRRILIEFNDTKTEYPKDKTIHELFEEQVEKTPDNIAVVFEDKKLTYRELNEKSNRLAWMLRENGVKSDAIVGIMVERSIEMIVGILGILKAGGAYLPLDPEYPMERIRYTLEDSETKILLTKYNLLQSINFDGKIIELDDQKINLCNNYNLEKINVPQNLAYIIYTSGTTGRPKGVMIEHKNVVRLLFNNKMKFDFNQKDVWTMFHSYCFDFSVWEMYGALLYGGKLVLISKNKAMDSGAYLRILKEEKVTILNQIPTPFYSLVDKELSYCTRELNLRYLVFGGEALKPKMLREWMNKYPETKLINMYGITETTVHVTYKEIGEEEINQDISNIGKPISTLTTYIMDKNLKLLPIGVPGELCIGGEGVARGYLNEKELTDKKFISNPYKLQERIYRSGDLARWLPDGDIEYLGRIDNQVKIRGFRIELGEIENQLLKNNEIKETVVIDKEDKQGNKYLCAYIVCEKELIIPELRGYLSKVLPDYMVPSYFIQLEKMPLTPNGKLDRRALSEPDGDINTGVEYVAARNEIEEKIVKVWNEILGVEKIGIDDDFFTLGGHSLKAIQVISMIHKELNVEVPVSEVFSNPTIRQLGDYIGKCKESIYSSIKVVREREVYKVSSAQKRLFALNQFGKESTNYNIPSVMMVEGKLEKYRVVETFRKLVKRHEAFRTSFEIVNEEIVQRIHKEVELNVEYEEIQDAKEKVINEKINNFIRPFDLSKAPLLRVKLLGISEDKHILMIDMHHIVSDGTTVEIIIEEFTKIYKREELEPLRIQYKDYAEWENELLESEGMKVQEEYWMKVFSDEIPILNMPADYARPTVQSFEGDRIIFKIDKDLTEKIRKIGDDNGSTLYMTLFSAYNILLSKYSGQEDIIVGSPIAGRNHADLEGIVGMFVNTLAMRNYPKRDKTFKEFLQCVRENSLRAYENQDYQFDELVEKVQVRRDLSRNALFDTMFILQNMANKEIEIDDLKFKAYDFEIKISKLDFMLTAVEINEEIGFTLEYCTKLFKRETVEKIGEHFLNILREIAENEEIMISEIEILSEEEKRSILVDFNNTKAEYSKDKTIHELFEEQVEKTPNSIAVVFEDKKLTYRELNEKSNSLATVLREKGVKADSIVGIIVERSLDMMVGILAVLKAGGAYLPIDPEYPKDRIEYTLEDSNANILLTQNHLIEKLAFNGIVVDLENEELYEENKANPESVNKSGDIAYVIYTSGSTGKPKGVMIEHRNVVNFIHGITRKIQMNENESILAVTTICFDMCILEIVLPITKGLKIIIVGNEFQKDGNKLSKFIYENNINIVQATPSRIQLLANSDDGLLCLNKVQKLLVGAEAWPQSLFEELKTLNIPKLYNLYGPTETTVWSSIKELTSSENINIGKPISNTSIYIVGENNRLQPIGVAGEICIAGDGLARGYLNKPELTAEKFVSNPYEPGTKMYKTGDLARWLPDGNVEFLGRIDNQVKIRGFRIELGEIENQLLKNEEVKEAVVVDKEDKAGNKYLCAYIVGEKELIIPELRRHLSKLLPDYMIPSYFMQIAKIPLTPNGKIDRKALPEPDGDINTGVEYVAARNEIEEKIVKVWNEILGVEKIGIDDDFFTLGGHSLKAIQVISMIHKEFNVEVPVSEVFSNPTIRQLGEYIGKCKESIYSSIKVVEEREAYKVSSAQKRLFTLNQFAKGEVNYNIPAIMIVEGKLDKSKVEETFRKLVKRHEAFRTSFEVVSEEIMQRIHKEVELSVEYEKIIKTKEEVINRMVDKFIRPFDLSEAPLLRVKLVEMSEAKHILMVDMHHIVSDGTTIGILIEEFAKIYKGEELEPLRIQYKDYAAWENELLESEGMKDQEEYWMKVFSDEIPVLNMPTDYTRPTVQSFEGDRIIVKIDKELTEKIRKIGDDNGATLYMTLLSAYNILLSKYSGQDDIIVGSPIAGRNHAELEGIVGMFVNTLAMRNYPKGEKTFKEFLQSAKENALKSYENQEYQFDKLVEKVQVRRDLSRNALFDTMFVLQNTDREKINIDDLKFEAYDFKNKISKFDLTLTATEINEEIGFTLEYCTKLFKKETVERIGEHFLNIVREIAENEDIKISEIEMLKEEEKRRILVDFNDTNKEYPKDKTMHELFEEQVEKTPDNVAVVFEDKKLTYKELNEKANSLARILREKGVRQESIVGIMVENSLEMIVGMVAILKAGGTYLPIDPEYPEDRIKYMLDNSGAKILVSQEKQRQRTRLIYEGEFIDLDSTSSYSDNVYNLGKTSEPNNLAYVVYTSGTTGQPKGVMIEHRNICSALQWRKDQYDLKTDDTTLQLFSNVFDGFITSFYTPIISGSKVIILNKESSRDIYAIREIIVKHNVTNFICIPSLCLAIMECLNSEEAASLRIVTLAGDQLTESLVSKCKSINQDLEIANEYGPTENSVISTIRRNVLVGTKITIGKPIGNTKIYILDELCKNVPIGVVGELCISGEGLARGYINRPELTAEKFIDNPYGPGERMYKTGDLARWLLDGNIEFLGRIDNQVKIRGFRIELGEIENQLLKNNEIKEAVVVDKEDNDGNKYLCAYIVSEKEIVISELRGNLSKVLPDYMIPSYFMQIEKIPLTPSGKIDRKTLPEPDRDINTGIEYIVPRNKVEQEIMKVWSKILGVEKIGIDDDFFVLGGHSLKAIKLEIELEKIGININFSEIYYYRTIRNIAEYVDGINNYNIKELNGDYAVEKLEGETQVFHSNRTIGKINGEIILKNIEPFNEVFFKNCFYNSLFPVIRHFNKNELPIMVNDVIMYCNSKKDELFSLGIDYLSTKPLEQVITELGIKCEIKNKSDDLVKDIIQAIDKKRCIIICIDCFYEPIRKDTYQKKHMPHTLLVYGYNEIQKNFDIIEHLDAESLTYEKRIIGFDEIISSYEGYLKNYSNNYEELLKNYSNNLAIPSYLEFFSDTDKQLTNIFNEINNGLYLKDYLYNVKKQGEDYINQLNNLEIFIRSFKILSIEEAVLKQNVQSILKSLNDVINAKQVERYKISKLFNNDFEGIKILNEIIDKWVIIRSIIVRYILTSVYKKRSLELAISKLEGLYELESNYCNIILNF